MTMPSAEPTAPGFRPPQQARSRLALQRMLTAAQEVLAAEGHDEFTMTAVADRAGMSVGTIYRRFDGKEQLLAAVKDRMLSELETDLAERLRAADPDLAGIISSFAATIADAFVTGGAAWPYLIRGTGRSLEARGVQALGTTRRLFIAAAWPHLGAVRRPDPEAAVDAVERMITGALIHQAAANASAGDGLPMREYGRRLCDMAVAYLLTPGHPGA